MTPASRRPRRLPSLVAAARFVVVAGVPAARRGMRAATRPASPPCPSRTRPPAAGSPARTRRPPGPSPTPWPGGVVEAIVILGKADLDIQKAGSDLGGRGADEDLQAMWGAADGLATLLERLQAQVDRIRDYPETAAAAATPTTRRSRTCSPARRASATRSTAKDAAGLTAGVQQLQTGTAAYAEARAPRSGRSSSRRS